MSATTKVRAARQSRLRWLVHSDIVSVATAGAIAVGVGFAFLRRPETIDTVSVTNPTDYDIGVAVRGAEGGWMPMSTAQRDSTTTVVSDVIDQGATWTFRFTAQGQQAGKSESVARHSKPLAGRSRSLSAARRSCATPAPYPRPDNEDGSVAQRPPAPPRRPHQRGSRADRRSAVMSAMPLSSARRGTRHRRTRSSSGTLRGRTPARCHRHRSPPARRQGHRASEPPRGTRASRPEAGQAAKSADQSAPSAEGYCVRKPQLLSECMSTLTRKSCSEG